jgi:hypothetical protein
MSAVSNAVPSCCHPLASCPTPPSLLSSTTRSITSPLSHRNLAHSLLPPRHSPRWPEPSPGIHSSIDFHFSFFLPQSVVNRSPPSLIREIILVDDLSTRSLFASGCQCRQQMPSFPRIPWLSIGVLSPAAASTDKVDSCRPASWPHPGPADGRPGGQRRSAHFPGRLFPFQVPN